jgi:glycosyltransferase involved in cell wall biosynthesis
LPYFSVIIPTHNRPDLLRRAVMSVLKQSDGDFELIVVDDGSVRPASEALRDIEDPRLSILRNSVAGGVSMARNRGVTEAKGEVISFLDDDDAFHRDYLAAMRLVFSNVRAGFAWVGQSILTPGMALPPSWLDRSLGPFLPIRHLPDPDLANIHVGCAQGFSVRKAAIDAVGAFDEELRYSEDFDLVVRLLAANWEAWRLDAPLMVHAVDPRGGLTNTPTRRRCLALFRVLRRNRAFLASRPGAREYLIRSIARDLVHGGYSRRAFRIIRFALSQPHESKWIRKVAINSYFFAFKRWLSGKPLDMRQPRKR